MKERTITIAKKDILFDVDAITHIFARANEKGNYEAADALSADSQEVFYSNVITRFADRRVSELKDLLSRFLKPDTSIPISQTDPQGAALSEGSYSFVFLVEDRFQDELLAPLAHRLESYISNGAISDWFYSVGNSQGPAYGQQLVPMLNEIMTYLTKRKFPSRTFADAPSNSSGSGTTEEENTNENPGQEENVSQGDDNQNPGTIVPELEDEPGQGG